MNREQYFAVVDEQIDRLLHATGLSWELENTGGGHDALVAYFLQDLDLNDPTTAFVMLTCDASVVVPGRDRYATLGYYPNVDIYDDCSQSAYLVVNDPADPPLTLDQLVDWVAETLQGWGF